MRHYDNRLIEPAVVLANLSPIGDTPANEAQVCDLLPMGNIDAAKVVENVRNCAQSEPPQSERQARPLGFRTHGSHIRHHANRLIESAGVVANVGPIGPKPLNEAQARPLASLPPWGVGRLYKATHGTFEEYCKERWGFSRPRAYQLIEAASAVSTIVDKGGKPPANEAQARPLASLPPAAQPAAWQEAALAVALKPMFERQARERMRERKGDQPGATVANLPHLAESKSRDQAAAAVGGRAGRLATGSGNHPRHR